MNIIINGKPEQTDAGNIAELVLSLGYEGDYFAVAKNLSAIPRSRYRETAVNENDEIEILTPMQGG